MVLVMKVFNEWTILTREDLKVDQMSGIFRPGRCVSDSDEETTGPRGTASIYSLSHEACQPLLSA